MILKNIINHLKIQLIKTYVSLVTHTKILKTNIENKWISILKMKSCIFSWFYKVSGDLSIEKLSIAVYRSSLRCAIKKMFLKISKYSQPRPATLLNRYSNTGVFLWILRNFQEHLFEKHLSTAAYEFNHSHKKQIVWKHGPF